MPRILDESLSTASDGDTEIAFFGGSFTGIERGLMCRLLDTAERYVQAGRARGIRLSTRPDMIDDAVLKILKGYTVTQIELGLQSMSDRVLEASRRGHTAERAATACRQVVENGFSLVGQMMIGLPQSTLEDELATAKIICDLGADACRIYPTVVLRDTPLAAMTERGDYLPLTVEEAVHRAARVLEVFTRRGVDCLRVGLCASEELTSEAHVVAGANHPALGELVWNEIYYQRLCSAVSDAGLVGKEIILTVSKREISKAVGQHRRNLLRLEREGGTRVRGIHGVEETGVLSVRRVEKKTNEGEHQLCI